MLASDQGGMLQAAATTARVHAPGATAVCNRTYHSNNSGGLYLCSFGAAPAGLMCRSHQLVQWCLVWYTASDQGNMLQAAATTARVRIPGPTTARSICRTYPAGGACRATAVLEYTVLHASCP